MQYILITGGAGYIGSHTNALLNALGVRTIVLDSLIYGHKEALEISENTESKKLTESTTPQNLSKALPSEIDSVCGTHPLKASSGWGERLRGGRERLRNSSPSPLSHKTSDVENLGSIRENEIPRNEEIRNLGNTETKINTENLKGQNLDSKISSSRIFSNFLESGVFFKGGQGGLNCEVAPLIPPLTPQTPDDASYGCSAQDNFTGKPSAKPQENLESRTNLEFNTDLESNANAESNLLDSQISQISLEDFLGTNGGGGASLA